MAEIYLEATALRLDYGTRTVIDIDYFPIYAGDRIGLIGENGAGKTTLLLLLAGEIQPDSGRIERRATIAGIRQTGLLTDGAIDSSARGLFKAPEARATLSGGEKTRLRIAGAYAANAEVLLADEPTTDLDADGIRLLTEKLRSYPGSVVLVSHDRKLLDDVCTSIAELKNGHLTIFPGKYSDYTAERERRREFSQFEYDQYRKEQARLTQAIQDTREAASQKHHLPSRMGISEARLHRRSATEAEAKLHQVHRSLQSRLDQLEVKERPESDPEIRMALGAGTPITSAKAVEIRGLTLSVPEKVLFEKGHALLKTGFRTALVGKNGAGKTTLIRRIIENNDPHIRVSPGVKIGYFGQEHEEVLDLTKPALENVMRSAICDESDARTVLARLNLRGDNVLKRCSILSGGERAKVCLAKLLTSDINLLILDEPTNHIDLYTAEALEELLSSYKGTLLFTSHDRYFCEKTANRIWAIENGKLIQFEGTFPEREELLLRNSDNESLQTEITLLELKLSALAARLSKPSKGDDPEKLNAEYLELAREINQKKRKLPQK